MIRKFHRGECTKKDLQPYLEILYAYRSSFKEPLTEAYNRLLAVQDLHGFAAETSRRIKKSETIFDKLKREPSLDLSRMQDIGGCRSVVRNLNELERLKHRISSVWDCRVTDYVANPRVSGYRAVHLIVNVQGKPIEVQLRTEAMHKWAQSVETLSEILGDNFKQDGSHVVQRFMFALSEVSYGLESGRDAPPDMLARVEGLQSKVVSLLKRARKRSRWEQS